MKKLYFDNDQEYEKWLTDNKTFVWAIYYGDDYLCDVLDDDYEYLCSIGFIFEGGDIDQALTKE